MFKNKDGTLSAKKITATIVVVVLLAVIGFGCFVVVPAGHTGVVVTMGSVGDVVLQEGIHVKTPFVQNVILMDNRIVKLEVSTEAFSKDLQTVSSVIAVNYRISKSDSNSIYKNFGVGFEDVLVRPAVNEVLKAVVAQYTASELVSHRSEVSVKLDEFIDQKLTGHGITIEDLNIIDWDFSQEYITAVEQKQVAEQNLIKTRTEQEQALVIAEAESKKKVIAAEAEAKSQLIQAEAEAKRIKLEAEAQAEANVKLAQSLSGELIQYETVNKWNGELPKVQGQNELLLDASAFIPEQPADER